MVEELYQRLKSRDSARNTSYNEILLMYSGNLLRNTKRLGFFAGITASLSSIFVPHDGDEDKSIQTPINLIKPAIENKVAYLSFPPTVRVIPPPAQFAPGAAAPALGAGAPTPLALGAGAPPPGAPPIGADAAAQSLAAPPAGAPPAVTAPSAVPGAPDPDWSENIADRLEQVIASLLALSNMPKRCRDVAWSVSAMDGAIIGVWPDIKHGVPRIFTRTPQDFYPVAYDADGLELSQAVWMEPMNGDDIMARWGVPDYIGQVDIEVVQMIDEQHFYTLLNHEQWAHPPVENPIGVVPIVCVGALGLPGMIFGSTDIKDAIPVAKQINYHMSLIDEMAQAMVHPTIIIKDPLNVPPDLAIGQGGVATMGPNGDARVLGPLDLPNSFWELSTTLQNWFDLISDNPAVLRSEGGGSIITGKGFNAQLGPIAARMQTRLDIIMGAYKQVIKYMLMLWANFPGDEPKALKGSGTAGKVTYYIEAMPEEFQVNGEMWTEIEVSLNAQNYMDTQGNAVELMQLYQNELLDWDSVADGLPQINNKKRVRDAINRDRIWKAQGIATANQVAQSGMTASAPIGAQEQTNQGLERGSMGETGPPPGPQTMQPQDPGTGVVPTGGPSPAGAPDGGPAGLPPGAPATGHPPTDLVNTLEQFFRSIPKLKGAVWFGGDPVSNPQAFASTNWSVTVWVEVPQDQGTITQAVRKYPELYGHLKFNVGTPPAAENAIQVSGDPSSAGATPPDASGGEAPSGPPAPDGTQPPDITPDTAAALGLGQ